MKKISIFIPVDKPLVAVEGSLEYEIKITKDVETLDTLSSALKALKKLMTMVKELPKENFNKGVVIYASNDGQSAYAIPAKPIESFVFRIDNEWLMPFPKE